MCRSGEQETATDKSGKEAVSAGGFNPLARSCASYKTAKATADSNFRDSYHHQNWRIQMLHIRLIRWHLGDLDASHTIICVGTFE